MSMIRTLLAMSLIAAATPAGAVTFVLGPADGGPVDETSSYRPGYRLYTFDDGTSPFIGGAVIPGSVIGQYAAPFGDTTPYFSVGPSTSSPATLALSGINQLSFYWGSIDTYNTITFDGLGVSFTGAAFGGSTSPTHRISREVTFSFSPSEAASLRGISLSSTSNAFELDNLIFGTSVPEPASWGMMVVGIGALGAMLRRRQRVTARPSPIA